MITSLPAGLTDDQLRATAVPVIVSSALPAGSNGIGSVTVTGSVAVTGTFWQATQPISASSLPLPAGAATETTLSALNTKVTACNTGAVTISAALPVGSNVIGGVTQSGTWTVTGPLTDTQLRATPVPVKDRGTASIATGRVTVDATADLIANSRSGRKRIQLVNVSTTVAFIGTSSVVSTTGLRLAQDVPVVIESEAEIYGVTSSGSATITYMEEYD